MAPIAPPSRTPPMPRTSDISIGVRMCANVSTIEPCAMVATRTSPKTTIVFQRRAAA